MADDGPTSPADSPAYQRAEDDTAPVPVASTIFSLKSLGFFSPLSRPAGLLARVCCRVVASLI
jgi:hypothetical protein